MAKYIDKSRITEVNGEQVKGFLIHKTPRPVHIKDLLSDSGEIRQSVFKEYMAMAEIVRIHEATRKLLVAAINKNIPQEKGDLTAQVENYDRSSFNKEKALKILATLGYSEADFTDTNKVNRLAII